MATRAGLSRGCYHSTRSIAALELPGAVQNRANSCGSAVIKRWAVRTPESAGIHENRRPQTHFARAGPERYLKLCPPQLIELAAKRVIGPAVVVCQKLVRVRSGGVVIAPLHARPHSANAGAADPRLAKEKIGSGVCRERGCSQGEVLVVAE